ncbi:MAG: hypothetical protein KGY54_06830 [Oleiphilaceae bacterium]|nr:hypothetical protein [Oleiphilaceae bacterium]
MKLSLPHGLLFFILLPAFATTASAATECDCDREIALCQVLSDYEKGKIILRSYTDQCSRVTYRINGIESTRVIVGGTAQIEWRHAAEPEVRIERCRICDFKSNTQDDAGVRIE